MKTLSILFFAVILTVVASRVQAQSLSIKTDILVWNANQLLDQVQNSTSDYTAQFITYGKSKIVWTQQNNYTNEFTIKSSSGTWDDPSTQGSIQYNVTLNGKSGTITLARTANGLQITTSLTDNGKNTMPYVFYVNALNKQ
jgi:hypothetical protein